MDAVDAVDYETNRKNLGFTISPPSAALVLNALMITVATKGVAKAPVQNKVRISDVDAIARTLLQGNGMLT
jgi:hypothetical protein